MLENKKLNMVISLLIAIALWAFVIGEVNPEATRAYRDVPIKFINEETLERSNMAVYSVSDRTMNLTLTGTRSEINKINSKDITATVDLKDAGMGENQLRVDLKVPSKVEIESQSINKVTVTIENRISKEIPVEVSYEGTFDGEEEPITVTQDRSTVTVYGAETTVGRVAAARAKVAENSVTQETQEFQCDLIAVNSAGQRIYNVDLSHSNVVITSELAKLKTVPLHVPLQGESGDGIEREVTTPDEITIKGKSADLEPIDAVESETIYLEDIVANTVIPIVPILPNDVEVSLESNNLEAVVKVTKIRTDTMRFDQTKVELRGLEDGFNAQIESSAIELRITGSESLMDSLTEENVSLFVDLSELREGRHKVQLQAVCNIDDVTIGISPKTVTVVIKSATGTEDQSSADDNADDNNNNDNNSNSNNNEE